MIKELPPPGYVPNSGYKSGGANEPKEAIWAFFCVDGADAFVRLALICVSTFLWTVTDCWASLDPVKVVEKDIFFQRVILEL
jgi:hypothetical protein